MTQEQIIKLSNEINVSPMKINLLIADAHRHGKKADLMDLFSFGKKSLQRARRED